MQIEWHWCLVASCLAALVALLVGYGLARLYDRFRLDNARARVAEITTQAKKEADTLRKEAELLAKDEVFKRREEIDREAELKRGELLEQQRKAEEGRDELREEERRLGKREDVLLKKERVLEHAQRKVSEKRAEIEKRFQEAEALVAQQTQLLHQVSSLTREDAEALLMQRLERELAEHVASRIQTHEDMLRTTCEEKARRIVGAAIQRYAADHTADTTVSTVDIPSDDMKGRIIGREGRNIRTFEKATGVDVIVDDTPGVVIVSAFDNIRRETARLALTKLIQDGRIHPSRIEEVVTETQQEMEKHIMEVGRAAVQEANIGQLHEKMIQLLGRLKFRTSYSQNVLHHSLEVSHLCGLMAEELKLDGRLARRCGLLHDVGKAADHEMEGGHPKVGAELARRYGETSKEVLHAIVGHHDDVTIDHIYTVLVAAADAISAARPGARRETLEKYVKRLEELEALASGFPGVEHAYAIQAGREVRVIADAGKTSDADAVRVCHEIARAIEQRLNYPGEIKVTVVRETRAIEFAR
jgi:ribonuclease Y